MGELADCLRKCVEARTHELAVSEDLQRLTQKAYYNAVVKGAKRKELFRRILPVAKVNSYRMKIVTSDADGYASKKALKAEVPYMHPKYTSSDVVIERAWTVPLAPKELIEDGEFDVIENEVQIAGEQLENTLNRDALSTLIDNAGNEETAAADFSDVLSTTASALADIGDSDFVPTHVIACPTFYFSFMQRTRQPFIRGLDLRLLSITSNGTKTWGWSSSGDVGAVALDASAAALILMREDITVKKYSDPLADLRGAIVSMKYKVAIRKSKAICIIKRA